MPMLRPTSSGRASRQSLGRVSRAKVSDAAVTQVTVAQAQPEPKRTYRFGQGAPKPAFDLTGTGPTVPDYSVGPPSSFSPCEVPTVINRKKRTTHPSLVHSFNHLDTSLDTEFLKLFGS